MSRGLLLFLLLAPFANSTETPFHPLEMVSPQDVGAVNENFRNTADSIRRADITSGGTVAGNLTLSGTGTLLTFPDGTTQTTAAVVAAAVVLSSRTFDLSDGNNNNRGFGPCITNSTTTITASGTYKIEISIVANETDSSTQEWWISFLQDGQWIAPFTSTLGCGGTHNGGATFNISQVTCSVIVPAPSAASHSYCLQIASQTNAIGASTKAKSYMIVKEVH